jgi:hypothetical protein
MEPITGFIGLCAFSELPVNNLVVLGLCCTPSIYRELLAIRTLVAHQSVVRKSRC